MLTTLFGDAWVGSSRPRAWLDVGAGNGELLLAVRSVLGEGIDLRGVEPNRHKRRHAADRGIELFEDLTHVVDRHFDVISLVDVYSHIADPPQFLRRLAQQLGERGSFFIVTGNGGDLASREQYPDELDLPDHLSFVGRDQLVGLMRELGFVATRIVEKRHDTLRRVARNVRRWLCGTRACVTLPYTSPFRSMWCRFDRAPS